MGCVSSKRPINSIHPNFFEVVNVDEDGQRVRAGYLEVTEKDLVLHHDNELSTVWPLKSLRRYGADSEIFSFESGRRAPTGEGVFAFHCQRAVELFNFVQAVVAAEEIATQNSSARTPDLVEVGGDQQRNAVSCTVRTNSVSSSGAVSPSVPPTSNSSPSSPPSSIPPMPGTPASAADFSPSGVVPLAEEESFGVEGDDSPCDDSNNNQHPYINFDIIEAVKHSASKDQLSQTCVPPEAPAPSVSYMNVGVPENVKSEPSSSLVNSEGLEEDIERDHVYMNVIPGLENIVAAEQVVPPLGVSIIAKPVPGVTLPYLAKVDSEGDLATKPTSRRKVLAELLIGQNHNEDTEEGAPWLAPYFTNLTERGSHNSKAMNYAVLDLDQQPSSPVAFNIPTGIHPESPVLPTNSATGYATIDFNKTEALSHSVNPNRMDIDHEGCRKTRHNSTISDFPTTVD